MKRIDSSLGFGFFVRDQEEFQDLYRYLITGNLVFENWGIGVQNKCEVEDGDQIRELVEEENQQKEEEEE